MTASYYDATALGTTIGLDDSTMTVLSEDDYPDYGFAKYWMCETSLSSEVSLDAAPTDAASVSCGRFLPKYTKEASADDLRFDAETNGELGTTDGSTITWAEAGEDTYEWTGAFQAATVAGAAALVALTF